MTKAEALLGISQLLEAFKTLEDLRGVDQLIRARWKLVKQQQAITAITSGIAVVGNQVKFMGRHGVTVQGVVEKVNRTTVSVRSTAGMRWTVAPGLLRSAV